MNLNWSLLIALGLVNWIATTILVDSSLFAKWRSWPITRWDYTARRCFAQEATGRGRWARYCVASRWLAKLHELVNCHLCMGTWVAFIQAAFFLDGPWYVWTTGALLIKAIGHLVLELRSRVAK